MSLVTAKLSVSPKIYVMGPSDNSCGGIVQRMVSMSECGVMRCYEVYCTLVPPFEVRRLG